MKKFKLSTNGKKKDLINRLIEFIKIKNGVQSKNENEQFDNEEVKDKQRKSQIEAYDDEIQRYGITKAIGPKFTSEMFDEDFKSAKIVFDLKYKCDQTPL